MPYFGAHMSIAGGFTTAVEQSIAHRCEAVQIFTKQPNQWAAKPIDDGAARTFKEALASSGVKVAVAHDSYLINLASPDEKLRRKSIDAFVEELNRADKLGLHYLVMHPGAHTSDTEEAGLARVAAALDEAHARCPDVGTRVLLENTAGQGTYLGWRFEHLASILNAVKHPTRLGVCIDTCHAFAAGYALAPETQYRATMADLDRLVGLERVKVFHVNDSLKPLGSRVDRHAHISRGAMGIEPFRLLLGDRRFRDRAFILETPKEEGDDADMDATNLGVLRRLAAEAERAAAG
jgi:deoxyribonuclease-4